MSRLDARWPLATAPWRPGTGGYGIHACRRVCIYDVAIAASVAPSGSDDAMGAAAMAVSAISSQPADEAAAIRAVLAEHGLGLPLVAAVVRLALEHERERLTRGLLPRGPRARRSAA